MTRLAAAWDRIAVLIFGLGLIALGGAAVLWRTDWLAAAPDTLTAPELVRAAQTGWWPWATTGAGLVLVLLGLWWLSRHRPAPRVHRLPLPGSDTAHGRLTADLGALADAAADSLGKYPDVVSAHGRAVLDRGTPTIELRANITSADAAPAVAEAADHTAATATDMLGDAIAVRTRLRIHSR